MLDWLDRLPLAPLAIAALLLGLAPFYPEPHLLEKLKMLAAGTLNRPIDIFDLLMHGTPAVLLVVKLISDVLDRGMRVAIGTETGVEPLEECSVVVSPYRVDGEVSGSIAVLGPTRMHYRESLAAVTMVSRQLEQRLNER